MGYDIWGSNPQISILRVSGFNLFLFIFFIFRPLNGIGLSWDITNGGKQSIVWLLIRFVSIIFIFLSLAVPFCLIPSIQFLHAPVALNNLWIDGIARFFCLFFFKIYLDEFVYRGVIQNLFHSALDFKSEANSFLKGIYRELSDLSPDPQSRDEHAVVLIDDQTHSVVGSDVVIEYAAFDTNTWAKCFCLRMANARDWIVIVIASLIYSLTSVNYKRFEATQDLIYGMILLFWLGFCSGWLYKVTHSCFISAVFNALIVFNFKYIFNPNTPFCDGAC